MIVVGGEVIDADFVAIRVVVEDALQEHDEQREKNDAGDEADDDKDNAAVRVVSVGWGHI